MLGYILAVLVGTGSIGLYVAAFFYPEVHRKQDFIWSSVGLFYGLALWIYARELSGGLLLGQTASVALLGWLSWQTFKLRRQLVPIERQTPLPTFLKSQPAPLPVERATPASQTKTTPPASKVPTTAKAAKERSARATAKQTASATPAPSSASTTPPDDEPWIKLEVKPSPDNSTLVKKVTRSAAPAQPEPVKSSAPPQPSAPSQPARQPAAPQSEPVKVERPTAAQPTQPPESTPPPARQAATNPPSPAPQPQRVTVDRSPVQPPPAPPQSEPVREVIEFSQPPAPPPSLTQLPTTPLIAAAKPLGTPVQPPATAQPESLPISATTSDRIATPEEPTLERAIAELESDIE